MYRFNIVLDNFANPNYTCILYNDEDANKIYSVLKLIVDKTYQYDFKITKNVLLFRLIGIFISFLQAREKDEVKYSVPSGSGMV